MAATPNFTAAQSLSTNSNVLFTDTSVDLVGGLTSRRISVRLANGNWLTSAGESTTIVYETWDITNSTITIILLTNSTVANITVEWLTNTTVTYAKTKLIEFDLYDYLFLFGKLQEQTATPTIISDSNYYANIFRMITNVFQSESAVVLMDDQYSGQAALDKNYYMMQQQNVFF